MSLWIRKYDVSTCFVRTLHANHGLYDIRIFGTPIAEPAITNRNTFPTYIDGESIYSYRADILLFY